MAQLVGCCPTKRKVTSLIPGQGSCLGWGFNPQSGHIQKATDGCSFPSLSPSTPFPWRKKGNGSGEGSGSVRGGGHGRDWLQCTCRCGTASASSGSGCPFHNPARPNPSLLYSVFLAIPMNFKRSEDITDVVPASGGPGAWWECFLSSLSKLVD